MVVSESISHLYIPASLSLVSFRSHFLVSPPPSRRVSLSRSFSSLPSFVFLSRVNYTTTTSHHIIFQPPITSYIFFPLLQLTAPTHLSVSPSIALPRSRLTPLYDFSSLLSKCCLVLLHFVLYSYLFLVGPFLFLPLLSRSHTTLGFLVSRLSSLVSSSIVLVTGLVSLSLLEVALQCSFCT